MNAIVYTSNTGFTARYAQMLGFATLLRADSRPRQKESLCKR